MQLYNFYYMNRDNTVYKLKDCSRLFSLRKVRDRYQILVSIKYYFQSTLDVHVLSESEVSAYFLTEFSHNQI